MHDPLTLRVLVVGSTALVSADVVGLDASTCRRIRQRCAGLAEVVVHATHTHGGPVSMPGRLGGDCDLEWLHSVEDAAVEAVREAVRALQPVTVVPWSSPGPSVATNRRRAGGTVDPLLPGLALVGADGDCVATVVSYACHPVVLGADNLLFTADYPGPLRRRIEDEIGGLAFFLTGCAGDANPGQVQVDPASASSGGGRSFADCAEVGEQLAEAALAGLREVRRRSSPWSVGSGGSELTEASLHRLPVTVEFAVPGIEALQAEVERWHHAVEVARDAQERALYSCWQQWARGKLEAAARADLDTDTDTDTGDGGPQRWAGTVAVLRWGPARILALPGEPFAGTGMQLRRRLGVPTAMVAGYCDGCPGYLPPREEYPFGGYEVQDAHRYYGAPGPFAPGAAETLLDAALRLPVN
ncbi:MAG TPA: hypothetical protein VK086_07235 [Ruania sp.]|nr:hypothetical protein [Ruania sp.]